MMANQQEAGAISSMRARKAAQRAGGGRCSTPSVAEAKAEAKHITEEARVDAERIAEQLRAQADVIEVGRIKVR